MDEVKTWLFAHRDEAYCAFNASLIPNLEKGHFVGVRTPLLRAYAKQLQNDGRADAFLAALPHEYFEEDQLHAFILSDIKEYDVLIDEIERFLPFVNNWATCDQLRPKIFKKHTLQLESHIETWLESDETYTVRFALGMLNTYYLDEEFDEKYLEWAARVKSGEYYVNMMLAWYFATALAKQYEAAVKYLTENRLDVWVHNKTIQKAKESFRIPQETKAFLDGIKRKQ